MIYRRAEAVDAASLADFGARAFVDSYAHCMERGELETYVREHFTPDLQSAEISDERGATFLALETQLAGYAQIVTGKQPECELDARAPAELKRIYVERTWHGHGVAQKLLLLIETEARIRACDGLWLAVWEINDRAISFYRKSGFEIAGRQGFPIGNEVQTDYVMAKPLGQ